MEVTSGPKVQIEIDGARVEIPSQIIADLWVSRLLGKHKATNAVTRAPPPVGCAWSGGTYAGVVRGADGSPDHYLIVLEQAPGALGWQPALDWARGLGDDVHIPTRRELALCFANVPELFEKSPYWSSEQYVGYAAYAWCQYFTSGYQYGNRKACGLRARAVRRLVI